MQRPVVASNEARAGVPEAAPRQSAAEPWIGRVIDQRYRILKLLGQGGMGEVFAAEHLRLHKQVALKVVRAELSGNGDVAARFAREAMATARFEHPHVASAIDYGTLPEGGAYLVMQLVGGASLRRLLQSSGRLPWRRVCEIAAQVADALSAARGAGIIHRDLKPDNISIEPREDGTDLVKVLDFGIAYVLPSEAWRREAERDLTREGTVIGTLGYMSPEQSLGDKIDHRSDLYTLGVVVWEAIAGRRLWGKSNFAGVLSEQLTQDVPLLRGLNIDASVPAELDQLLQCLTARAPEGRPEHAALVRDAFRRLGRPSTRPASLVRAALARMRGFTLLRGTSARAVTSASGRRPGLGVSRAARTPAARLLEAGWTSVVIGNLFMLGWPFVATSPRVAREAAGAVKAAQVLRTPEGGRFATDGRPRSALTGGNPIPAAANRLRPAIESGDPDVPPVLVAAVRTLLEGNTGRERRSAADSIANYQPAERVPRPLRVIAEFERARNCTPRKDAIAKMREAPDPRYEATLQRLYRRKNGCGFLGLSDCYTCIRSDLREALDAMHSTDEAVH